MSVSGRKYAFDPSRAILASLMHTFGQNQSFPETEKPADAGFLYFLDRARVCENTVSKETLLKSGFTRGL